MAPPATTTTTTTAAMSLARYTSLLQRQSKHSVDYFNSVVGTLHENASYCVRIQSVDSGVEERM